ncbi:MAG: hypothetical protein DRP96_07880 [Candidatus Neomarinimicrobiota bacterium]|nr:MAG: hypothetical protein DRP96_07880 [Candidatus Neomarinimicrobiota bacterium]
MIIKKVESVSKVKVIDDGVKDVEKQVLLGPDDGVPNFIMRQFTVQPGGYTFYHTHDYEHEVYIVSGRGIARNDKNEVAIEKQNVILVTPNEVHQFVNNGTEPLVFLCLIPKS